jgi:DNA-binding response OmpR family regulator
VPSRFLVSSADADTRALLKRAFAQFSVVPEECAGTVEALALLKRNYDGVIVDFDDTDLALQLVAGIRTHHENATVVVALLPQELPVKQALSAGAHLALNKPLRIDHISRGLRVSFRLSRPSERAPQPGQTIVG